MTQNNLAFTFASSEVNLFGRVFIQVTEFGTGKIKLKKLYDQYLKENRPPENFWHDAIDKLQINIDPHYISPSPIPKKGRLIIIANHPFGVVDGVTMCSLLTRVRQDYKLITHKVLRQAEAVKKNIIPIDLAQTKAALVANIQSRKEAEKVLNQEGVILIFPSGEISTKPKLNRKIKAVEGEWKQFTSKLSIRTKSPVLPMFFEGQNSELFHIANKIGQAFRYSLMMYELKRRIGKNIKVHIGEVIPFEKIKEIGDLIKITKFLRNKTFKLDPDNKK